MKNENSIFSKAVVRSLTGIELKVVDPVMPGIVSFCKEIFPIHENAIK